MPTTLCEPRLARPAKPVCLAPWRACWRKLAATFPLEGLRALRDALADNSRHLIYGSTVLTTARSGREDLVAACPIGYCGWRGAGLATADAVREFFRQACLVWDADPTGTNPFVDWWDSPYTPRAEARRELLAEVDLELERRAAS